MSIDSQVWIRGHQLRKRWGGMANSTFYDRLNKGHIPAAEYPFGSSTPYWRLSAIEQHEIREASRDPTSFEEEPTTKVKHALDRVLDWSMREQLDPEISSLVVRFAAILSERKQRRLIAESGRKDSCPPDRKTGRARSKDLSITGPPPSTN